LRDAVLLRYASWCYLQRAPRGKLLKILRLSFDFSAHNAEVEGSSPSMEQMNEIVQGKSAPSRRSLVDATSVKKLCSKLGLSQPKFAALLRVDVGTLRNWEQGRREPTGPAKALLTAISRDPEHVLKALAA
jgi:putative transcriptional regulator